MIQALSYVGITSPAAVEWRTFGPEILGLEDVSCSGEDVIRLRMDDIAWRVAIHPGEKNTLQYVGWDVGDKAGFDRVIQALEGHGVSTELGDAALNAARDAEAVCYFHDPAGFRHELCYGRARAHAPFASPQGVDFVTGANGMGHVVLMVPELQAASDFFLGVLGFRHSDDVEVGRTIRFMHCNPRHHTLAFTQAPGHRGMHHLMLEVASLDDVGYAYDRAVAAGHVMAMGIGRHPNDLMTSFYVRTPSGFEIEYGTGGRLLNMADPEPAGHYTVTSLWGHKPPPEPIMLGMLEPVPAS